MEIDDVNLMQQLRRFYILIPTTIGAKNLLKEIVAASRLVVAKVKLVVILYPE